MGTDTVDVIGNVDRWFDRHPKLVVWAGLPILIALAVFAGLNYSTNREQEAHIRTVIARNHVLAVQGKQAHDALCVFRADLRGRADASEQFMRAHPDVLARLGISPADMARSIASQRATIRSLSILNCKETPP